MLRVSAGLQEIQAATRMRPPDPEANPLGVVHATSSLGSEASAKDLLSKLDSMHAQVQQTFHTHSAASGTSQMIA